MIETFWDWLNTLHPALMWWLIVNIAGFIIIGAVFVLGFISIRLYVLGRKLDDWIFS